MTQLTDLHHQVLDALGASIVRGDHPAGTVWRLDELERTHQVSRTVVREAIRVLESMGVVESRRRVGIIVRSRESWRVFDPMIIRWRLSGDDRLQQLATLSQLRAAIEPAAAALAAMHATAGQCGALTAAVIGMSITGQEGDLDAYLDHDIMFHRVVLQASGNDMFAAIADTVAEVLAGRTHHDLMPTRPEVSAIRLHGDVAESIQLGKPDAAQAAMRAIVDESAEAMRLPVD
ncbi:FCD domain-containing protein [Nocardioidaceae bacterium SCSIO 66511]|nr:FCD domain-containing protein [Nocardioidaceae bacterium SCSIO 66511]